MYRLEILNEFEGVDEAEDFNTLPEVEWAIQDRVENGLDISLVRVYKKLEIKITVNAIVI